MNRLTILVVGGYGVFGGRIVELLEAEPRLTLIVAGRSLERAAAFCIARQQAKARLVPIAFDRNGDVGALLKVHRPDILIDASGPFQAYGLCQYLVIEACIANGINYLDLADGSDFVAGVPAFDADARTAGVYVLSGVSSFPVLTAAVVRRLSSDMSGIETIRGGIAPSPYARVGVNVIRAISGYAGQRAMLRRAGTDAVGFPFTEQMRFTIAPPGCVPVRNTLFSLVDVPDLRALVGLWPEAKIIWMGAGPVPEMLHYALIGLAWLVRLRLLPSLRPFASLSSTLS
jgi:Saccharopine dehydrogenase NADP binding domain